MLVVFNYFNERLLLSRHVERHRIAERCWRIAPYQWLFCVSWWLYPGFISV